MAQAIATLCVGAVTYTIGYAHPIEVFFAQVMFIVFLCGLDVAAALVSTWRQRRDAAEQAAWERKFGAIDQDRDADGMKIVRGTYH